MASSIKTIESFSPEALESVGHYVYALIDPAYDEGTPCRYFYFGRGQGNRCFAHARDELKQAEAAEPGLKLATIRRIRESTGVRPPIMILDSGLTKDDAVRLEAILIKLHRTEANLKSGNRADSYCRSVESVDSSFQNSIRLTEIGARVLLVSLSGGGKVVAWPEILETDLEGRVLGEWRLRRDKAAQVEYVIGVYHELVRCVFRTAEPTGRFDRRNCGTDERPNWKIVFHGVRDSTKEQAWTGRTIMDDEGRILTKFRRRQGCQFVDASAN